MRRSWLWLCCASVLGFASIVTAASLAGPAAAVGTGAAQAAPTVRLIAAQSDITVQSSGGMMLLDPGIYVASLGAAFQLDVRRARYSAPVTADQVLGLRSGGTLTRPWPAAVLDGLYGLRDFAQLSVANASGEVVASKQQAFCPNFYIPQRTAAASAEMSIFPQACAFDPFAKSLVIGIAKGWGVDPFASLIPLAPGTYKVTATIDPVYVRLLHITRTDATATVNVTVEKGGESRGTEAPADAPLSPATSLPGSSGQAYSRPTATLPTVRLAAPPKSALPDLIALPAWQISTKDVRGRDLLGFGATVWVGGNGPLDVRGFRVTGSPAMRAYQYFWKNGQVIGRVSAGTMGFDSQHGHNHWHFQQFAAYRLLGAGKRLVIRSQKQGFCISPTDPVDLLAPHAVWQPPSIGLAGECGQATALSVQEFMPVGWGDTYLQSVAGQAFDITRVPNGTYYIEIAANPLHVLHELSSANDISLRKVVLGGSRGHRTVRVPAWRGLDPEN